MKNKLCYILLGVFVCLAFADVVWATGNLAFTLTATPDSTTVVKGKEVTITLNLKSDSPVEMCQFQVQADSTLEYVDWNTSNLWKIDTGTIDNFTIENDVNTTTPLTNGENILQIKYRVNGDGRVTIKTEDCSYVVDGGENDLNGTHEDVVVDITSKEAGEDYTLSNLEVTNGKLLTPITTPINVPYVITLDSSTFGLKATASNPDYNNSIVFKDVNGNVISDPSNITFSGDGGQTSMTITVTVNNQKTYTLFISYERKELDNSLKSITISGVELPLVAGQIDYDYTVGKDVTSFDVVVELNDSTNFKFGDGSNFLDGTFVIGSDGISYVNIEVVPIDSSIGAESVLYTVTVTREGNVSTPPADNNDKPSDNGGSSNNTGNNGGTTNNGNSSNNSSSGNVNSNPTTGDISKFLMAIILIASLVGSIIIYQKNLEGYK